MICACCGAGVLQSEFGEVAMLEAPDFDTRPGEPARSTISRWVSCCACCGYCSADLTHIHESGPGLVRSSEYRFLLEDFRLNAKAREFLCYSSVLEHAGQFADSGWSALHAAWTCDDMQEEKGATSCRLRAVSLWQRGKDAQQNFGDDEASEFALAADVYRRAGDFENAIYTVSAGLDLDILEPTMNLLLRKEKSFIELRDQSCYNLAILQ